MNEKIYLGTYTKRDSKGAHFVTLNKETGTTRISVILEAISIIQRIFRIQRTTNYYSLLEKG